MPLDLNSQFALHGRALSVASQRLNLLADNLANADTPHYKARDIDFKAAMASATKDQVRLKTTAAGHMADDGPGSPAKVMYRIPDQPSQDGNTVNSQKESAAVAETAVRYQTALTFLNSRIRGLRLAITGSR